VDDHEEYEVSFLSTTDMRTEEDMHKRYVVNLTDDERARLRGLVHKGTLAARKLTRAHILLQAYEDVSDQAIAEALHAGRTTVERVRKRFVEGSLDAALTERPRPGGKRKLDGKAEATLWRSRAN
jgi:hypothetical protein